jgi:hypothetical protein
MATSWWVMEGMLLQDPLFLHCRGTTQARWFGGLVHFFGEDCLESGDVAVFLTWSISGDPNGEHWGGLELIRAAQARGVRVLMDVDGPFTGEKQVRGQLLRTLEGDSSLLFNVSNLQLEIIENRIRKAHRRHAAELRAADALTCNNSFTAELAREFNPNVFVC